MARERLYFLESEFGRPKAEKSLFHILPVPFEESVSYGGGTANGPAAIIEASQNLEVWDGFSIPGRRGIHTHPPLDCEGGAETVLARLEESVGAILDAKAIPVALGGEHSITPGAVRAAANRYPGLGIVHFDAHADLRDRYEDNPNSHACALRRVRDLGLPLHQFGVRSLSPEEVEYRKSGGISWHDGRDFALKGLPDPILPSDFPANVYLTFDVDAWDPSIMPATGTPEPGGLSWYDCIRAIEEVARTRRIVGFDVVELAPIEKLHACDFTVAKFLYCVMGIVERGMSNFW